MFDMFWVTCFTKTYKNPCKGEIECKNLNGQQNSQVIILFRSTENT